MLLTLQFPQPEAAGPARIQVVLRDGDRVRHASSWLRSELTEEDGEKVRWYFEDYPAEPADPAPVLAAEIERRLAEIGEQLFIDVFGTSDGASLSAQVQSRLPETRIEVISDDRTGPAVPWELMRDPSTDIALAVNAEAFVRTNPWAAARPVLPEPSEDRLRVLLVICRPGGKDDVPFRSVASRLIRGGATQMEGLELDVLARPRSRDCHRSCTLTITVLVGQALRDHLATAQDIEAFVGRLKAGEDAVLGRTRSLAASLSYGYAQASIR
jgi:hypothetical protein